MGERTVKLSPPSEHTSDSVFVAKSQKGYRAREALLDAALELIAEKGVDGYSIGELCKRAGIKRTSFYTYFPTLKDLLIELARREDAAYDAAVDEAYGKYDAGIRRFAYSVVHFFRMAESDDTLGWNRTAIEMLAMHEETWERSVSGLRKDIDAAIENREIRLAPEQVEGFIHMCLATMMGIKSLLDDGRLSRGTGIQFTSMLLRAAGTSEASISEIVDRIRDTD